MKPLSICLVGIEGVGKTQAVNFLTKHFQVASALEYGDFYCRTVLQGYCQNGVFLTTQADFIKIVQKQRQLWNKVIAQSKTKGFCFFDTDHIYTKYFIDKQFTNWTWIDQYIVKQPIDLFIFLKRKSVQIKKNSLIKESTVTRETKLLLSYYRQWVPAKQLLVIDNNDYIQTQKILVDHVKKFLTKNAFL